METVETVEAPVVEAAPEEKPEKPARKTRTRKKAVDEAPADEAAAPAEEVVPEKPKRRTRKAAAKPVVEAEDVAEVKETVAAETQVETIAEPKSTEPVVTSSESEDRKPKRSGWWQKKGFF